MNQDINFFSYGNLSVKVWQHKQQDCCHFRTVTECSDIEANKAFAGDDLIEFEEKVIRNETYAIQ